MKADLSRDTFVARKHFAGVLTQQGRVPVDADPNEQLAIQRHRDYTEAEDVIGACGAPKHEAGFLVQPTPDGKDLVIGPGRFYVHGRLCELESTPVNATWQSNTVVTVDTWHVDGADFVQNQYVEMVATGVAPLIARVQAADQTTRRLTFVSSIAAFQGAAGLRVRRLVTYLSQPDLPDPPFATPPGPQPPSLALPNGAYVVYLDVWPRHMTALDDESIREMALGGPDTATRIKTVWQVKLWPGPNDRNALPADTDCGTPTGWDDLAAAPTGRLTARTKPGPATDDPCIIPPGAGYLGLENQLYRVEVHDGGTLGVDPITFVWSRDNGSVVKALEPIAGTTSFTADTGPDDVLGLANGQWVEQVDDAVVLNNVARDLFQFQIDPITAAVTLNFPVDQSRHPQLRRWDSPGQVTVPPLGGGWLDLEDGVQVQFAPGTYRRGDYWLIPARTVLGDIEWSRDGAGVPVAQPRLGVAHHYCRVGVLHVAGAALSVDDCRNVFPPLNELKSTYTCCTYTVGDGVAHVGDFTTIQEAVNRLPADGGQICLYPGTYIENIRIDGRRNVHITGCGRRSRVVSRPPNADGVAAAVFTISDSERVKIESLAVEAAPAAPGILVVGERRPSRGVFLQRLLVTARRDSAIKVREGEDVLIERCRVAMLDGNGGWPGIFLRALDSTVRENVVEGSLVGKEGRATFGLTGSMAVSALQLGGGCERIRVHDNLFRGCSGQGITLGSLIEVDRQGRPVDPRGGGGWVVDRNDPCFPCEDPTTGDRPPRDDVDDPPTRLESEGDLYDIDIRRNRIFDMGLDGIGVAHFFDIERRQSTPGFVRVEDLAIVDNRIERVVRRGFAPIPPRMLDLMAYGGIALSIVEGLVIRDNRIEDLGFGGLLPTCGIFVLYGEGVEIARNHVLNAGTERVNSDAVALAGRRGGIHIVYARSLEATTSTQGSGPPLTTMRAVAALMPGIRRLEAAAVVEENSVDVARGQALSIGAIGPVSALSNRLISRGLVGPDRRALLQSGTASGPVNVLTHFASLVAIVTLTSPGAALGAANFSAATKSPNTPSLAAVADRPAVTSNVLFDDNQCLLHLTGQENEGPLLLPAILILCLDDVGFQDNQCDCVISERSLMPVATVILALWSQRAVSNRFKETLGRAFYSALTFALMDMTVDNQANHCLWVRGLLLQQDQPNHVLVSALQKEYCGMSAQRFAAVLRALVR
jgi:hypothetical protein